MGDRGSAESEVLFNPSRQFLGRKNSILSTSKPRYHVRDFAGPLSIKWMVSGWGLWETAGGQFRVAPGSYLVLNHDQTYSVTIDLDEPSESFCIFFARGFVEDVYRALVLDHDRLLSDPTGDRTTALPFFEHVWPDDGQIIPHLFRIRTGLQSKRADAGWLDDQFRALALCLLESRRAIQRSIAAVAAARPSTRNELHHRLLRARDYMHGHFAAPLSIDAVASVGCLSPHHFHRLFTRLFRQTPHQYLITLRMERAKRLLKDTDWPVTEICFEAGFESLGAFSTRFTREVGMPPIRYRTKSAN